MRTDLVAIPISDERRRTLMQAADYRCQVDDCAGRASYVVLLPTTGEPGAACGRCAGPARASLGVVGSW